MREYEKLASRIAAELSEVPELDGTQMAIGLEPLEDGYFNVLLKYDDLSITGDLLNHLMNSAKFGEVEIDDMSADEAVITAMIDASDFIDDDEDNEADTISKINELLRDCIGDYEDDPEEWDEDDCDCDCDCGWEDEENYEDYDDYDDYEDEPLEKVYPKTIDGVHVLFVMNTNIEEGKAIADPYVGHDFKVAMGNSYEEVAEKYAADIEMLHSCGLETAIMAPSYEVLSKITIQGMKYIPKVEKIYNSKGAMEDAVRALMNGIAIPDEVIKRVAEGAEALKTINPDDNYHAGK